MWRKSVYKTGNMKQKIMVGVPDKVEFTIIDQGKKRDCFRPKNEPIVANNNITTFSLVKIIVILQLQSPMFKVLKVSLNLFLDLKKANNSLWTGLEHEPNAYICKHIRMTATATINPCDLFQILFCLPISHHHSPYNSLSLHQDFAVFYAPQTESTKRAGQRGVAFVLVPLCLPPLFSLSLLVPLQGSGVIITLSVEDLTMDQLGHCLGEAPISMRVCYFSPSLLPCLLFCQAVPLTSGGSQNNLPEAIRSLNLKSATVYWYRCQIRK